jgi:hypothetical protein
MSERPTPETDAAVIASNGQWSFALKEICEKLERERDKAREDATNYYAKIGELTEERDEARKQGNIHHDNFLFAQREAFEMREAIIATLEENRHLADGDDCTLAKLKSVVPDWK